VGHAISSADSRWQTKTAKAINVVIWLIALLLSVSPALHMHQPDPSIIGFTRQNDQIPITNCWRPGVMTVRSSRGELLEA
jgi:hypothetical protein